MVSMKKRENELRKPRWIRSSFQHTEQAKQVRNVIREKKLFTVCEESACPNRGECYNRGVCTFLLMGSICTRGCRFCEVIHGHPLPLNEYEPEKVAESVQSLGLSYVVITSVDRDDLPDGGAAHFSKTIEEIHKLNPNVKIEVLTPDFQGDKEAIRRVLKAKPDVFAHNVETVRRLTPLVRDRKANYQLSLDVLKIAASENGKIPVKSGLMVGLGETDEEVLETLSDIRKTGTVGVTIGQYLPPTRNHLTVKRYVPPVQFHKYAEEAYKLDFISVVSGPLVRSSYHADMIIKSFSIFNCFT